METTREPQSPNPPVEPRLQEFKDYRDFLSERIAYQKKLNPNVSLGSLARRMKVSTSFLSVLLAKKKHMSLESIALISQTLNLPEVDRMLLIFMLLEATAQSPEQKVFFAYLTGQVRGLKLWDRPLEKHDMSELHALYGNELTMTLDALTRTQHFKNDVDWVAARLIGSSPEDRPRIEAALKKLQEARERMGAATGESILAYSLTGSAPHNHNIYETGLAASRRALAESELRRPNVFTTLSVPLSREAAKRAIGEFLNFCKKLDEISEECKEADEVYFFNAGFFRATNP